MRSRIKFLGVLLCIPLMLACHRAAAHSPYPAPPADSYRVESLSLTSGNDSRDVSVAYVKPNFIDAVKAQPAVGRFFNAMEYKLTPQGVAVISHHLWQQRYGSDPGVMGKPINLNGKNVVVVGIMPKGFDLPGKTEVWLPDAS
jgi:hypothetical protein